MLSRIFAAAVLLAVLTGTAPAHAAYVETLEADLNLHLSSGDQLTGTLDLTRNDLFPCCGSNANPYSLAGSSLAVDGSPLIPLFTGNTGYPGTQDHFEFFVAPFNTPIAIPFNLEINTADIGNLTYLDFPGAISGTVTVLSETVVATPLPAALPLFGSGVIALAGFAWRSRGKVS